MGIETIIGLGLGVGGLMQNQDAARSQRDAQSDASALNWDALNFQKDIFKRFSEPSMQALLSLAQGYDPIAESRASTDYAKEMTGQTLERALRGFDTSYRAGGGIPGNSSLHAAKQTAVMKPVAQQLAGIIAQETSNATAKKANMWQALLGNAQPGQLGQSYFQAAGNLANMAGNMPQGDFGGSSRLISDVLSQLFKPSTQGGAGGSADNRYRGWGDSSSDSDNQGRVTW